MFLKNSRYHGLPTVTAKDRAGTEVAAVKLRRLPIPAGLIRTPSRPLLQFLSRTAATRHDLEIDTSPNL